MSQENLAIMMLSCINEVTTCTITKKIAKKSLDMIIEGCTKQELTNALKKL